MFVYLLLQITIDQLDFFSGEGSFFICITKYVKNKSRIYVRLIIRVGQYPRDKLLIEHLVNTLNCGYTFEHKTKSYTEFVVSRFEDIYYKIIPLLKKKNIKFMGKNVLILKIFVK